MDHDPKKTRPESGRPRRQASFPRIIAVCGALAAGVAAVGFGLAIWDGGVPATTSEAGKSNLATARALVVKWDNATREEITLAGSTLADIVARYPGDAEAWAVYAMQASASFLLAHDRSESRLELARLSAERASALAPGTYDSRLARASHLRTQERTVGEAERILRGLLEERPGDAFVLRLLASALRARAGDGGPVMDEAVALLDRAIAIDPSAHYSKFVLLWTAGRFADAEAVVDRGLGIAPGANLFRAKAMLAATYRGDLDRAAGLVGGFPAAYLQEDAAAYWASRIHLWRRDGDRALEMLGRFRRELIECAEFTGPKSYLVGEAHRLAGRETEARAAYVAALRTTAEYLAREPGSSLWNRWQVRLLAALGRREDMESALDLHVRNAPATDSGLDMVRAYALLGHGEALVAALERNFESVRASRTGAFEAYHTQVAFSPELDALADIPAFRLLRGRSAEEFASRQPR